MFEGGIDIITPFEISSWFVHYKSNDYKTVQLLMDNKLIAESTLNILREDIILHTSVKGNYGFSIKLKDTEIKSNS